MGKRKMSAVDRAFYKIDRERLWKEQEGKCHYCKKSIKREEATMDHVIPIKNTKYHSTANCVVSCGPCNQKKGSQEKIPLEWWEVFIQEGLKRLDRRVRLAEYRIGLYVGTEESKGSFNQWERYHMKRGRWG